ncbi:Signal transducer regulating beta-lactamase production, contains metallopeptidase domain [Salegentibacter echinorum]|uniref:Signal transducer regulating beta-lactamase production, contains metallopeptidase domain n=1 Tax=Salegentibacter echinorum TaxID=1073325 RepID=A0A1M5LZ81_SALEC|nr:M56 family metallopeptidase [Salegentibacter echinorum]SHG69713.1 Signal transducer regulating beta-lactamase production, contains metallopeptidase domain [Salegentibacter echinorum]
MMEALSLYVLKSAALLSAFYLVYLLLLRKDTNFTINRKFLLSGIFISALLPSIEITRKKIVSDSGFSINEYLINSQNTGNIEAANSWGFLEIFGLIYVLLTSFFLLKLILQLLSIRRLIKVDVTRDGKINKKTGKYIFIQSNLNTSPFSFFNFIVYNPALYNKEELEIILTHEKVHCQQYHSIDILLANICTAMLWFNPISWYYKKTIAQNLEFIADKKTVDFTSEKKKYQRAMLKVSTKNFSAPLTNNFQQSFIKKRIIMLNKNKTPGFSFWKISCVLPIILAFMLIFNVKIEAQAKSNFKQDSFTTEDIENTGTNESQPSVQTVDPIYILNGEISTKEIVQLIDSKKISSVNVLKGEAAIAIYGEKAKNGAIIIITKESEISGKNNHPYKDLQRIKKLRINNLSENSENINAFQKDAKQAKLSTEKENSQLIKPKPLIVIDGKKQDKEFQINNINTDDIAKINVLKGKTALEKYGEEGNTGVIEIKMK